jgi:uncharacterized protein with ParB-like and HNH nuclease domain
LQVTETNIQQLLGGPKQLRIPLFQRTYTWSERDHAQLWRDTSRPKRTCRASIASTGGQDGHFIGSLRAGPDARTGNACRLPGGRLVLGAVTSCP